MSNTTRKKSRRSKAEQQKILDDALAVAQAGAFSCVVEGTIEPLARRITEAIDIPTIGIGGSPVCDGQILVTEDMLGLFGEFTPKFVKRCASFRARHISSRKKSLRRSSKALNVPALMNGAQ